MKNRTVGNCFEVVLVAGLVSLSACSKSSPEARAVTSDTPVKQAATVAPQPAAPAETVAESAESPEETASKVVETPKPAEKAAPKVVETLRPPKNANPRPKQAMRPPGLRSRATPGVAQSEEMKVAVATILKGWENIQSISVKMTTDVNQRGGTQQRRTGEATIDYKRSGNKTLVRMLNFDAIWAKTEEKQVFTGERITRVYDGEFLYTQQDLHKFKDAFKNHYQPGVFPAIGGPDLVAQLRGMNYLRLDSDFELDGKDVYRFTGRSNKRYSLILAVGKESGLLLKMWVSDSKLQAKSEATFSDFVINPEFPDDHFTFVVPEGVTLKDLTVQGPEGPNPPPKKP